MKMKITDHRLAALAINARAEKEFDEKESWNA